MMIRLNIYGKIVEYDGRPLGLYKPKKEGGLEYRIADVCEFQKISADTPIEDFAQFMRKLRSAAYSQFRGQFGESKVPDGYSANIRGLRNTVVFCDLTLNSIGIDASAHK